MLDDPVLNILVFLLSLYLLRMYLQDVRSWKEGKPHPKALPGATTANRTIILIGIVGALIILGIEVAGEVVLGVYEEQSTLAWISLFALLSAAIIEEIIFRGFLVVDKKGPLVLIASMVVFAGVFAILHPHLWTTVEEGETPDLSLPYLDIVFHFDSAKAWFTTTILFVNGLFWYSLRFLPMNPNRSLLPCMISHAVSNVGVFVVKLATGHVSGIFSVPGASE